MQQVTDLLRVTYPDGRTEWASVWIVALLTEDGTHLEYLARDLIRYAEDCKQRETPFHLSRVADMMGEVEGFTEPDYTSEGILVYRAGKDPDTIAVFIEP